jgi:hypothetical protein
LDGQRILGNECRICFVCYGCIMWTILDVVDLGRGPWVWVDGASYMAIKMCRVKVPTKKWGVLGM